MSRSDDSEWPPIAKSDDVGYVAACVFPGVVEEIPDDLCGDDGKFWSFVSVGVIGIRRSRSRF